MRAREWQKDLLLVLGACVATALVAEVVLRLVWHPESEQTVIVAHPAYGWGLHPGRAMHSVASDRGLDYHIAVNAFGLRDRDRTPSAPAGTRRVLFLGDSVVFGAGVEAADRCTERLESLLGPGVEVVNAGVSGWGTDQEYLWLVREGFLLHPDVVVLGLCMLNDVLNVMLPHELFGSAPKPHFELQAGGLHLVPAAMRPGPDRSQRGSQWLKHSRLLRFVGRHIRLWQVRVHPAPVRRTMAPYYPEDLENDASHWAVFRQPYTPRFETAFQVTEALITAMRDSCSARGVPFVLVAFPNKVEVDSLERVQELRHYGYDAAWFDLTAPYQRLRRLADRLDVPFVYPLDEFEQAARRKPLFFTRDGHPNAAGHAVVATACAPTLAAALRPDASHHASRR